MQSSSNYYQFQSIKPYIYENYQYYRILQPKVIFIHGLPQRLADYNLLKSHLQSYGKIQNLTIQFISKNFYSSFVHYQSDICACLAIAALDNFYIDKRILKVSFASTKFCPNFLRGYSCYLQNCNYAHYYIADLAHLKDFAKQINHKVIAWNKIWENYHEILLFLFNNQTKSNIFPSGLSKFHDILFFKNQDIVQVQKRIQQGLMILQQKLQKSRKNSKTSSMKCSQEIIKVQKISQLNLKLDQNQWDNLDDSISDFVQDDQSSETFSNLNFCQHPEGSVFSLTSMNRPKSKTKIQKFLQQAESQLMNLIFKSQMQEYVF